MGIYRCRYRYTYTHKSVYIDFAFKTIIDQNVETLICNRLDIYTTYSYKTQEWNLEFIYICLSSHRAQTYLPLANAASPKMCALFPVEGRADQEALEGRGHYFPLPLCKLLTPQWVSSDLSCSCSKSEEKKGAGRLQNEGIGMARAFPCPSHGLLPSVSPPFLPIPTIAFNAFDGHGGIRR